MRVHVHVVFIGLGLIFLVIGMLSGGRHGGRTATVDFLPSPAHFGATFHTEIHVPRRIRVLALTTLALSLTAFTLKDPEFEIEFPAGWEVGAKDKDGLITAKPGGGTDDGANCNVYFVDRASIKGTQAALNKEYGAPLSDAAWNDFLSTKAEDTRITDRAAVPTGGKVLQIATVEIISSKAKARIGFIVTPGRVFDAGCYVLETSFERYKAQFDKIVRSLKPK